jgi:ribonuclease Z
MLNRSPPLDVYGPKGIMEFMDFIVNSFNFNLTFQINAHEIGEGTIYEEKEYSICAAWGDHILPNLAYALVEKKRMGRFYPENALKLEIPKGSLWSRLQRGEDVQLQDGRIIKSLDVTGPKRDGRKIVYSGDTKFSENIVKFAKGADLLIHEATLDDDYAERTGEEGHSTSSQAALAAKEADVKKLFLTHISARYIYDVSVLVEQARKIFPETYVAEDLMSIEVPLIN